MSIYKLNIDKLKEVTSVSSFANEINVSRQYLYSLTSSRYITDRNKNFSALEPYLELVTEEFYVDTDKIKKDYKQVDIIRKFDLSRTYVWKLYNGKKRVTKNNKIYDFLYQYKLDTPAITEEKSSTYAEQNKEKEN